MSSSNRDLYKEAGVDVGKGDALVDWLKSDQSQTGSNRLGEPVAGIGGFAALYKPNFSGMQQPLLVSSTDGVGTKLLLGLEQSILRGLGQDLVAMCINDLYTIGARPLFFLDYYATGELDEDQFKQVLGGIREALDLTGCALLGGETAELPGLYSRGHFDLAGFVVGVVDAAKKIDGQGAKPGDLIFAMPSDGFHSNGYSLIRKWIAATKPNADLMSALLRPTRIYHRLPDMLDELTPGAVRGLAHITGGGISGNLPRVLPEGVQAVIDWSAIQTPAWMKEFIESHTEDCFDVEGVFNLGIGMMAVVSKEAAEQFKAVAEAFGQEAYQVGVVQACAEGVTKADVHYSNLKKGS